MTATVNMPVASTVSCTVTANISSSATGNLVNTATITSPIGVPDAVPGNNSASTTAIGPSADLAVTKSDGLTFYTPGTNVTYTITVKNNGPLIVNGATFTDAMPAQITAWTWTCVADTGAICNPGPSAASPITDTITIPAGNKVVYTVVAAVGGGASGNIVNTATVQNPVNIPDLVPGNNSATDTDLPPSADLSVTKTDGVTYYPPGGTVTYTIEVNNNGPQDITTPANPISFTDPKPAQVTSWIWTCVASSGATCNPGPTTTNVDFADPAVLIPVGGKVRYTVVASIDPAAAGDMINTATAMVPPIMTDPNLANNSATDKDLHPIADLAVAVSDQINTYTNGGTTIYTVTVTNNGPSNVIGATLTGLFPVAPGATLDNWTWTCVPQIGASCSATGLPIVGNFTDATLNIPAGRSVTYTVVAKISTMVAPLPALTVTVTVAPPAAPPQNVVPDPNLVNNTATDIDAPPGP